MDVRNYEPAMETAAELGGTRVLSSIWTPERNYYLRSLRNLRPGKQYNLTELEYVPIAAVNTLAATVDVLSR